MNILDKIIKSKKEEVEVRKSLFPAENLVYCKYFDRECLSLKENLLKENALGIIAEFKRKSPSKGFINQHADPFRITSAYAAAGASGLSILTDHEYFGGSTEDLLRSRVNEVPILRKDFIIDAYQVLESKAMGADVILLIAACLSPAAVSELAGVAKEHGMEVLLELHEATELDRICDAIDMVGINNRNLKTFKVDIKRSLKLSRLLPADKIKVAESGIDDVATINTFRAAGYKGFLMGEAFMKQTDPGQAFEQFVKKIKI